MCRFMTWTPKFLPSCSFQPYTALGYLPDHTDVYILFYKDEYERILFLLVSHLRFKLPASAKSGMNHISPASNE